MSIDVQDEVLIERPRNVVGEFVFNPKCDKIWKTGLSKVFPISPGNYAKGSKVEYVGDFLGRGFSTIVIVTRAEPDTSLELVADDPFPLKMRLDLKDDDAGTKIRFRVQSVDEHGYPMPATTVAKAMLDKVKTDLRKLKKHLEEAE